MKRHLEKLWSKYTLYVVCIIALNLIEFLRSTQTGAVWKPAANCTGFVMMVIIFSQLPVRQFLKPVNYLYTILCIVAAGLVYLHWTRHIGEYSFGQMATAIMNIWWLGLIVCYFFHQIFEKKALKLHIGALGWTWIALTLWTIVSVAGRWWPIWYLFMFGAFYLIRFSKEDRQAFAEAVIDGTIISFFFIQGYAYLFRPFDIIRYKGAFANSNMMALYYLIVYCMILFKIHLLHVRNVKWWWRVLALTGAGSLLGFLFLTVCRTSWVSAILATACYGWIAFRKARGERVIKLILRGSILIITAVVLFPAVFWSVRWLPTIRPHPIWHEGEWRTDSVFSWDPPDSEKYVEMDEVREDAVGRIYNIFQIFNIKSPFVLNVHAEGTENEENVIPEPDYDWQRSSMVVRKVFFQTYWEHATWLGHPEEDGHYIFEESRVYMWHGQNLWIQIVYYFGYPAGAFLAVLIILTLWKAGKNAKRIKADPYAVMPIVICVVYFVFGLTEVVWNPGQLVLALVFLVMHPQLVGEDAG